MGADGQETTNDMYHENTMMSKENSNLRTRIKAMQETIDVLTAKNAQLLADKEVKARADRRWESILSILYMLGGLDKIFARKLRRQLIYFLEKGSEKGNSATFLFE